MNFYGKRPDDYVKPVLNTGVSMTKKSQQKETDVANIMKKFDRTGILSHMSKHEPTYMDVPAIDFQEAMNLVNSASNAFDDLPSAVRKKFKNNPAEFLEYCQSATSEELVEMGLAEPPRNNEIPSEEPKDAPA